MNTDLLAIIIQQLCEALVARRLDHRAKWITARGQTCADHREAPQVRAQGEHAFAFLERALDMFFSLQDDRGNNLLPGEMHHPGGFEHSLRKVQPGTPS